MNNSFEWYQKLNKPFFAPPSWIFGPVWTFLYIIIFSTYSYVFYKILKGDYPLKVAIPFVINIIANALFTPLQFGLRNNYLALLDILIVLSSLIWLTILIHQYNKFVSYAQIPYLIWVIFATILQVSITWLNR